MAVHREGSGLVEPDAIPGESSGAAFTEFRSGGEGENSGDVCLAACGWAEAAGGWPGIPRGRVAGVQASGPGVAGGARVEEAEERRAADHEHGRRGPALRNRPGAAVARKSRRREAVGG